MQNAARRFATTVKYFRVLSVPAILVLFASISTVSAQVRFEVPLRVTDGVETDTLYFGIIPDAVFGLRFGVGVPTDSINGHEEYELPPLPPTGVFDTRMVWPRAGTSLEPPAGFGQGSPHDYRPYTSLAQRDTFRVRAQFGAGTSMVASWPAGLATRFTALEMRYFDGTSLVVADMLTNTSADITNANGDPHIGTIYSGGLLVSVDQTSPGVPEQFGLHQNYPNPFNPSTTISFDIQYAAATDISVYNVLGQKVTTLVSDRLTPGTYTTTWSGKNYRGGDVSSGVYFVRMNAQADNGNAFSAIRKLLLMK